MNRKSKNGVVPYLMIAGKDIVSAEMPLAYAKYIRTHGVETQSNRFPGYPICVDDKFFFTENKTTSKSNKPLRKK